MRQPTIAVLLRVLVGASVGIGCGPRPGDSLGAGAAEPGVTELVLREFQLGPEWGGSIEAVWLEPGREQGIDTEDPCCGLWYDGNQYADSLGTCAGNGNNCDDHLWAVAPALAHDPMCGQERRCVPLPEARVVLLDGSASSVEDLAGNSLSSGNDPAGVAYRPVEVTREGALVVVRGPSGEGQEWIAVDFGAQFTIYMADGRVRRVTRDHVGR